MRRMLSFVLTASLWTVMALPVAQAQDVAAGEALAKQHCSCCHAIRASGDNLVSQAPPFRIIVKRYDPQGLEEALAEGIIVGHPLMPEFVFEPVEIGDLIAYLRTLIPPE